MRNKGRILLVILLVFAGICVMVYPSLSNYINTLNGSRVIQEHVAQMNSANSGELARQRLLAEEYNGSLSGVIAGDVFAENSGTEVAEEYYSIMNFGNGIMGYIQIPKIKVELPVYHGVSETVLQKGVGHMPQTAFPIGGTGNHTVLTGHTGLPSAELFTDLTALAIGDMFYITVLGDTLAYRVDQIKVVLPYEIDHLAVSGDRDICTLVTCTPYGINSHRLLVRGVRVRMDQQTVEQQSDAQRPSAIPGSNVEPPLELLLATATLIYLFGVATFVALYRKKKIRKRVKII